MTVYTNDDKELLKFSLKFIKHKGGGVKFSLPKKYKILWLPKSQIEVDRVSHEEDFEMLSSNSLVDVYIPRWLAMEKELI